MKYLIISLLFIIQFGEPGIQGDYCFNEKYSQTCLEFFSKNRFRYEKVSDMGVIDGRGTYLFKNDSLHLTFETLDKPQTQVAVYIGEHNIIKDTTWSYQILKFDREQLILKDKNGKLKYRAVRDMNENKK